MIAMMGTVRRLYTVREEGAGYEARDPAYENEGSERRVHGSVSVAPDAWWSAKLTVPMVDGGVVFVQLERHGPVPTGYRGGGDAAELSVPIGEVDAVLALLTGAVAHARRDGVLDARETAPAPVPPRGVPRRGDRVYWAGDATHGRREGSVTNVYIAGRAGPDELVMDVLWDAPAPGDPQPWAGTSRSVPVARLREPGWGWVNTRQT